MRTSRASPVASPSGKFGSSRIASIEFYSNPDRAGPIVFAVVLKCLDFSNVTLRTSATIGSSTTISIYISKILPLKQLKCYRYVQFRERNRTIATHQKTKKYRSQLRLYKGEAGKIVISNHICVINFLIMFFHG